VSRSRLHRLLRADRGSFTLFAVIFTIGVLWLALMLADLGGIMNAKERAADTAAQAARAAAETLVSQDLRAGNVVIDTATACDAARQLVQQYKAASGVDAVVPADGCTYQGLRQASVTVEVTTSPVFSGLIGSFTETATESACAEFGVTTGAAC
jgi:Flp pilus assembly protein TadG